MPYIHREGGIIVALTKKPNGSGEYLEYDHEDVAIFINPTYKEKRINEFPDINDVVDSICKYIELGDKSEFNEMQLIRNTIKGKYPKQI